MPDGRSRRAAKDREQKAEPPQAPDQSSSPGVPDEDVQKSSE